MLRSHHAPRINPVRDQLSEEEREIHAPEGKRQHLEMKRGEAVNLIQNLVSFH